MIHSRAVFALLLGVCGNFHKILKYRKIFSRLSLTRDDYLSSIEINNYEPYIYSQVDLLAKPCFIAITGKSGSGKSKMISSLEFMIKTKSQMKDKLTYTLSPQDNQNDDMKITITKADEQKYTRTLNKRTKQSQCYINNKKVSLQTLISHLPIRIWSHESLKLFQSASTQSNSDDSSLNGIIQYIDDIIPNHTYYQSIIHTIYQQWKLAYKEVQEMKKYQNVNESIVQSLQIQHHYIQELNTTLFVPLHIIFENMINILQDLSYHNNEYTIKKTTVNDIMVNDNVELITERQLWFDNSKENDTPSLMDMINTLRNTDNFLLSMIQSTDTIEKSNININLWDILNQCETYTYTLESICTIIPSISSTNNHNKNKHSNIVDTHYINNRFMDIIQELNQYELQIEEIHDKMTYLGLHPSVFTTDLNTTLNMLKSASNNLNIANSNIQSFQQLWPYEDLIQLLQNIRQLKQIWINLALKHNCSPLVFMDKFVHYMKEIHTIQHIDILLPDKEFIEQKYRRHYIEITYAYSQLRQYSSLLLQYRVNDILLTLDMSDKCIHITHDYQYTCTSSDNIMENNDNTKTIEVLIKALDPENTLLKYGIDNFYLSINHHNNIQNNRQPYILTYKNLTSTIKSIINDNYTDNDSVCNSEKDKKESTNYTPMQSNLQQRQRVQTGYSFDTLSSGEKSRLALAFETCLLELQSPPELTTQDDNNNNNLKMSEMNRLQHHIIEVINSIQSSIGSETSFSTTVTSSSSSSNDSISEVNTSDLKHSLSISTTTTTTTTTSPSIATIIFDELDSFVGGETAVSITKLLKKQSKQYQIIAVTHNPIVAAAADMHLVVHKDISKHSYSTTMSSGSTIKHIEGEAREQELLRMLTGQLSIGTVDAARQLVHELLQYNYDDDDKHNLGSKDIQIENPAIMNNPDNTVYSDLLNESSISSKNVQLNHTNTTLKYSSL